MEFKFSLFSILNNFFFVFQLLKISVRDSLKDKGSFHKESRQVKISSSLCNGLRNSDRLDSDSESILLHTAMSLLSKMIDFGKPFHVTLLGISVSDFVTSHKNGIEAYFGGKGLTKNPDSNKNQNVESFTQKPDSNKNPNVETFTQKSKNVESPKKSDSSPSTSTLEPRNGNSMPKSNDSEICSGSKRKAEQFESESRNLPSGWDEDVFNSLPQEMQQELLTSASSQSSPMFQAKKKPKSSANSILNYFGKK